MESDPNVVWILAQVMGDVGAGEVPSSRKRPACGNGNCRGGSADRDVVDAKGCICVPPASPSYTLRRVWLSQQEEGHYFGLANLGSRRIRSSQVVSENCVKFDDGIIC